MKTSDYERRFIVAFFFGTTWVQQIHNHFHSSYFLYLN
jgi:hypothetical protein